MTLARLKHPSPSMHLAPLCFDAALGEGQSASAHAPPQRVCAVEIATVGIKSKESDT